MGLCAPWSAPAGRPAHSGHSGNACGVNELRDISSHWQGDSLGETPTDSLQWVGPPGTPDPPSLSEVRSVSGSGHPLWLPDVPPPPPPPPERGEAGVDLAPPPSGEAGRFCHALLPLPRWPPAKRMGRGRSSFHSPPLGSGASFRTSSLSPLSAACPVPCSALAPRLTEIVLTVITRRHTAPPPPSPHTRHSSWERGIPHTWRPRKSALDSGQ